MGNFFSYFYEEENPYFNMEKKGSIWAHYFPRKPAQMPDIYANLTLENLKKGKYNDLSINKRSNFRQL